MPNYLRWIFILPAAYATYYAIPFIILFVSSFIPLPERIIIIFNLIPSIVISPFFFVVVGAKVAPNHKYYVSIILTAILILLILFESVILFLAIDIKSKGTVDPLWWLITRSFLEVAVAIFACYLIKTGKIK